MALAYNIVRGAIGQSGQYKTTVYDITLDTDYPTAGWSIPAQSVGLDSFFGASILGITSVTSGTPVTTSYVYQLDVINQKLQVFASGADAGDGLAEAAAGLNALADRIVRIQFLGY